MLVIDWLNDISIKILYKYDHCPSQHYIITTIIANGDGDCYW